MIFLFVLFFQLIHFLQVVQYVGNYLLKLKMLKNPHLVCSKLVESVSFMIKMFYILFKYFQCNVTPTRLRNEKKRNEDREPTFVDLRQFGPKAIVTFEDVPVSKTARRLTIVNNLFPENLRVSISKSQKFRVPKTMSLSSGPSTSSTLSRAKIQKLFGVH